MRATIPTLLILAAWPGPCLGQGVPFVGVGSDGSAASGVTSPEGGPSRPFGVLPPRGRGPLDGLPGPPAFGSQAYPGTGRGMPALPAWPTGGFRDYGYGPGSYVPGPWSGFR